MNAPLPSHLRFDIHGLAQAINHCHASDALICKFSVADWEILAAHMQPFALGGGQVLIEQGANDRTLYFVESGTLSVHREDDRSRIRRAFISSGSVVGEGTFFSLQPRIATVQASGDCKLWFLSFARFLELSNCHCAIALELTLALGAVMAKRLYIRPKRVAVT